MFNKNAELDSQFIDLRWPSPSRVSGPLVRGLFRVDTPLFQGAYSLCTQDLLRHYSSLWSRSGQFLVKQGVVETGFCSVQACACKVQLIQARPVDSSQAHGARLATGV